jgi:hypothetical protein
VGNVPNSRYLSISPVTEGEVKQEPKPPDAGDDWSQPANIPNTLPFPSKPLPLPPKWSASAADAPLSGIWEKLNPENISCTGSSCKDALHCFRLTKKMAKTLGPGTCRDCKRALVAVNRVAGRNLNDVDHTFSALQLEYVRHYFWHVPFGMKAMNYAMRAGRIELESRIVKRLQQRIGSAEPYHDGWQTPISTSKADALDFAMHVTAACCRKCVEYWHGIPQGQALTDREIMYLGELMRKYLRARLPDLDDHPQIVPRPRRDGSRCRDRSS